MSSNVILRDVNEDDLPIFFEQQSDTTANYMAAFTAKDPSDKVAFKAHWEKILDDERIIKKTIIFNGQVAGQVSSFEHFGEPAVSYWIGREYWGKGVATRALSQLLDYVNIRPIYARAAKDNIASIRVLEKCGFKICGEDKGFSNARTEEVEEYVLKLPF
jgi:RimJ/RimL family protein N-acetyltransferase